MRITLPSITPHTIRHLHTTFRVKKVRELFSSPAERERALEALVDDLGWRSAEMLKTYDHAISRAELRELLASSVRQLLEDAPHDAACLQALLRQRMGDLPGARERHRLIGQLQQLRHEMRLLAEAERHGSWTPHWKQLAPASRS